MCDPTVKQGLENQAQVSTISVPFQKWYVLCLPPLAIWSFKTAHTSLCWISSAPLENIQCAHYISPDMIRSKSASTNIATSCSPHAQLQDVLKCQMLSSTKKHFTTFSLRHSVTEKAETALTFADVLEPNVLLLSYGRSRAINAASVSTELATVPWQKHNLKTISFLQDSEDSSLCPSRRIAGRWSWQRGADMQVIPLLQGGSRGEAGKLPTTAAIVCLLPLAYG